MKNNLLKIGSVIALAGLLFAACKKDGSNASGKSGSSNLDIGLTADNVSTGLSNNATDGTLTTQSAGSASVTWTSGTATVSSFKLEAKLNGLEIEVKSNKMASINLFAPVPPFVSVLIDTGVYREIEIKAMLAKSSGSDIPLVLKGSFTSSAGTAIPIELDYNDDATIKAEAKDVTVDASTDLSTLLTLHLSKLLDHVTAATLEAADKTNGTIVISGSSNTRIYSAVRDNIGNCGEGGEFEHHGKGKH